MIFFIVECEIDFDYNNYIKLPIGHELLLYLRPRRKAGSFTLYEPFPIWK